jgi:hypothetical protein
MGDIYRMNILAVKHTTDFFQKELANYSPAVFFQKYKANLTPRFCFENLYAEGSIIMKLSTTISAR